jgi:hypothetical protein
LDLLGLLLGDFPVLAIQTPEIAARGGNGKDGSARMKVIERLLFNGIQVNRAGVPISQGIELAANIDLGPAYAAISRFQKTEIRAYLALDVLAVRGVVKALYGPLPGLCRPILLEDLSLDTFRAGLAEAEPAAGAKDS